MSAFEKYTEIGQQLETEFGTTMGQMFGKACLKTGKKAFAAFSNDAMIFKIGQQEVDLLLQKYVGSEKWDPSGKKRPMKDWLLLGEEYSDDWPNLAKQAKDFVETL